MRIFNMPRQTGKTTMLLSKLELDPKAIMVVHSWPERERLHHELHIRWENNPEIAAQIADRIITIDHVISGKLRGRQFSEIHIDNLDLILPYLIGGRLGDVTYTGDYSYGNTTY